MATRTDPMGGALLALPTLCEGRLVTQAADLLPGGVTYMADSVGSGCSAGAGTGGAGGAAAGAGGGGGRGGGVAGVPRSAGSAAVTRGWAAAFSLLMVRSVSISSVSQRTSRSTDSK